MLPLSCASRSLRVLLQGCLWPRCLIAAPAAELSILRARRSAKDDGGFRGVASEKCCSNARTDVSSDCRLPSWALLPGRLLKCKSHLRGLCIEPWWQRQPSTWVVHLSPDVFMCSLQVADQCLVTTSLCMKSIKGMEASSEHCLLL